MLITVAPDQFSISDPGKKLTPYIFGRRLQSHDFCAICGTSVSITKLSVSPQEFQRWEGDRDQRGWENESWVNLRCFLGLDFEKIKVVRESEKDSEPRYEVPA